MITCESNKQHFVPYAENGEELELERLNVTKEIPPNVLPDH